MNSVFVCVGCGWQFYAKAYLLRHSLVHQASKHSDKTSPHKHISSPNISKQEALKAYLLVTIANCGQRKMIKCGV